MNGKDADRPGNRHPTMAPHGLFPVAGDDRWIAIACQSDEQWQALCAEAGLDSALAAYDDEARKANEDELEGLIAAWTAGLDGLELQSRLQELGVACHISATSTDLAEDPQLAHREHFIPGEHAENGTMYVEGSRFKLSRTPAEITQAGPTVGQHTFDVLLGVLGYDDEKLSELVVAEVLE